MPRLLSLGAENMIYSISSGKVVKLLYGSSSNILREDPGSFEI